MRVPSRNDAALREATEAREEALQHADGRVVLVAFSAFHTSSIVRVFAMGFMWVAAVAIYCLGKSLMALGGNL